MFAGKQHLVQVIREISHSSDKGLSFIRSQGNSEFLSYASLYDSALRVLFLLQQKGIRPKNEVVLQVSDEKRFLICFWACLLGGMIPVPLSLVRNHEHRKKLNAVWDILNDPLLLISGNDLSRLETKFEGFLQQPAWQSRIVLLDDLFNGHEHGTIHEPSENDIAFIQFSSGSTGNPKGVTLTHRNLIANMEAIAVAAGYTQDDVLLSWMPLTHDMGMIGFHLNPLFCGIDQVLIQVELFVKQPTIWLDTATAYHATVLCSPNFGYRYLLKHGRDWNRPWDLSKVRIIYNGAEPISEDLARAFNGRLSAYHLSEKAMCPVYGLAEASVAVSMSAVMDEIKCIRLNRNKLNIGDRIEVASPDSPNPSFVNVGTPVNYCAVSIINKEHRLLKDGTIGYVAIKGLNVTAGYYNNLPASQEAIDSAGWLNTGDLGFMIDGSLYITGRSKDIIFFNGQNFYPHDIEREAESLTGIELNKIAIAGHFNHLLQEEEILAFVLHRGSLEAFVEIAVSLKAHLNRQLGFEMSKVLPVKDIPKTTSGKIQRFRLVERYINNEFAEIEHELAVIEKNTLKEIRLPANYMEKKILGMWEDIFEKSPISVLDHFFETGGNSLKAVALAMRFQKEFEVHFPVSKLYELPTIRSLSRQMDSLQRVDYTPVPKATQQDVYPLSFMQKRLYYAWKLDPLSIAYNVPTAFTIKGKPAVSKLVQCLEELIRRHDALRMTFLMKDMPMFEVRSEIKISFDCIDYSATALNEKLVSLVQPFNLHQRPLCRFYLLVNTEDEQYVLFLDLHHIICDGQSVYYLLDELLRLYAGEELPSPGISYRDFVMWEKQQEQHEALKKFWATQLSGELPVLRMPLDFQRPPLFHTAGKRIESRFDQRIAKQLYQYATAWQVPIHDLLFALYQLLLFKFSEDEDIITGIPVMGRIHPDLQGIPGMFVNNLPIRTKLEPGLSFQAWVKKVSGNIREALKHGQLPFDTILSLIDVQSHAGRNPLFDTMFLFQNFGMPEKRGSDLELSRHLFDPGYSRFDLTLEIVEEAGSIRYAFEYATKLYSAGLITALSSAFQQITQNALEDPAMSIEILSPLTPEEEELFIVSFNNTVNDHPGSITWLHLFDKQVALNPNAMAIQHNARSLTFHELNGLARRVADALLKKGLAKNDIVGICLPLCPELIIGILGILMAGGAYLPIDEDLPADRVSFMLHNSGAAFLLTDPGVRKVKHDAGVELLYVHELIENTVTTHQRVAVTTNDLAYLIYTSGTSGRPKGVMISHGALNNYIFFSSKQYVRSEKISFALYSSISFDLTVTSIFTPLITGNTMIIYGGDTMQLAIEKVVCDNQAELVKLTPSHLKLLLNNGLLLQNTSIRRFIVGGESLDSQLARDVYRIMKGRVEIFNEYGPTEATVGCMIYTFNPDDEHVHVPIGKPISNMQIYLLDKYLQPVPFLAEGEIYIAGEGLAEGYLGQKELTAKTFISNPFLPGKKMYRTGDIGRRFVNGDLGFLGRKDLQVKINGHRMELAEIASVLMEHAVIQTAVVTQDPATGKLQAYYTQKNNMVVSETDLRNYLAGQMPYYMIPVSFIELEHIPLTQNGKVDVNALPAPAAAFSKRMVKRAVTETEKTLLEVWKQVLGKNGMEPEDNFFALGGDSIMASQISSKLFEKGLYIKVKDILTFQTIEQVSRQTQPVLSHSNNATTPEGEMRPLPVQSWFFHQQFSDPGHYTQSVLLKLNRSIHLQILLQSFRALIKHHDTLRLNVSAGGETLFYNDHGREDEFVVAKISVGDDRTLSEVCNTIRGSFDINKSLLLNAAVITDKDGTEYLFIVGHHLVMDGISWRILLEDLNQVYYSHFSEGVVELPVKTASFKDWINEMYRLSEEAFFESEKAYWKNIEETNFSITSDREVIDWSLKHTSRKMISLDAAATYYLLTGANKAYSTDVHILLNVAFVMALHEWRQLNECIIYQENHGRHLEEKVNVARTLGWFTAMYPVKLRYEQDIDLLIKATKESIRQVPNNGLGYGMNKYLGPLSGMDRCPEIRINYLGQFGREFDNELFSFSHQYTGEESGSSNHFTAKLELNAMVMADQLWMSFAWHNKLFGEQEIERLISSFHDHLYQLLEHLKKVKQLQYTPSDFSASGIAEDDLKILLG